MRSPRIVVAMLALALTASMAFTASSASAQAESRPGIGAQKTVAHKTGVTERAATYKITSKVVKRRLRPNGPRQLVIVGKVTPAKGPVYVQRATKCNKSAGTCNFKFYRKVGIKKGRYQAKIDAPRGLRAWVWRVKVGSSVSEDLWLTCTKRPFQSCKAPY